MKKVPALLLTVVSAFALSGCGMLSNIMSELQKTPDALPKTKDEARAAVAKYARDRDGVEFKYTFRDGTEEGTGILGQKNGSMWEILVNNNDKVVGGYVAISNGDDTYEKYTYDPNDNAFTWENTLRGYSAQDLPKDFGNYTSPNWLFYAHSQQLTKKGESEILGRRCLDYEFTYNGIAGQLGEEMEYNVSIDEELCITMKITIYEASSSSGRMNMDMVYIHTGSDVVIPEVVEQQQQQGGEGE